MGNVLVNVSGCEFNAEELGFVRNVATGCWNKICASWDEAQEVASKVAPVKGKYLGSSKHYKGETTLLNYVFDMDELDVYYF